MIGVALDGGENVLDPWENERRGERCRRKTEMCRRGEEEEIEESGGRKEEDDVAFQVPVWDLRPFRRWGECWAERWCWGWIRIRDAVLSVSIVDAGCVLIESLKRASVRRVVESKWKYA